MHLRRTVIQDNEVHISFDFTKNSDSVDIEIQYSKKYGTFWLNVRYLCILKDHVILFLNITDNITTLREREFIL